MHFFLLNQFFFLLINLIFLFFLLINSNLFINLEFQDRVCYLVVLIKTFAVIFKRSCNVVFVFCTVIFRINCCVPS